MSNVRNSSTGGTLSSTTYSTLSWKSASLAGYYFAGWTTTSGGTSPTWTSGNITSPGSSVYYYAVWRKDFELRNSVNDIQKISRYYPYTTTANQRQYVTLDNPTLSGYTFVGYAYSSNVTLIYTADASTIQIDSGSSQTKVLTAVWNGDYVVSTNNSSSVSTYGSTITASFYTGSGSAVSAKSAYRQQYYTYDTGYYDQNHSYNFSAHSGSQTNKETERYYRLVNNGSTGSWSTSIPILSLTVPYATSTLSGKTFSGWDIGASTNTAD